MQQSPRLTYLSTATLYGPREDVEILTEDLTPRPVSMYDASKYMGEVALSAMAQSLDLRWTALRPSFVYGPGSGIGEYFLPQALAGIAVDKPVGAAHPCEYTYVKDLAQAIFLTQAGDAPTNGAYNVSSGQYRTLGDLAEIVRSRIPEADIRVGAGRDPNRHRRIQMSIERARTDLGYRPRYTLEEGIDDWLATERRPG